VDVFLVPVGGDRYELYSEVRILGGPHQNAPASGRQPGFWKRFMDRFRAIVQDAEAEAEALPAPRARGGLWGAIRRRLAEAVVEQRLLWHLRGVTEARLVVPDDLGPDAAVQLARDAFARDVSRHVRWCLIDAGLLLACAPLTLIPGPNLPALYFACRATGHALAYRGAVRGRDRITWDVVPRAALTAVRAAASLDSGARASTIDRASRDLGLPRLAAFLTRVRRVQN
jgi:hypothetical protein